MHDDDVISLTPAALDALAAECEFAGISAPNRVRGTVKWFRPDLGYGFIAGEDGNDTYVHFSFIRYPRRDSYRFLLEGEEVEYTAETGPRGRYAVNVTVVNHVDVDGTT